MTTTLLDPPRLDPAHRDQTPPAHAPCGLGAAQVAFLAGFPRFDPDGSFAALRQREYNRLDADHHVYLDYTGSGLHAASQVDAQVALLQNGVLGNPHSNNPTSLAATALVEQTRLRVCEFFNAS